MQRLRDTEQYSRVLAMPGAHGIHASWLRGQEGKPLKSVIFHSLGPHQRQAPYTNMLWRPRAAERTVLKSTEEFWRSRAPSATLEFWRQATQAHRSFVIREGSTVSQLEDGASPEHESGFDVVNSGAWSFVRVQSIVSIDGELHIACETWKVPAMAFRVLGQPAEVTIDTVAGLFVMPADRVRQLAFALPCGQHNMMFTKRSGFHFKSG